LGRKFLNEVINTSPFANDQILKLSCKLCFVGSNAVPVEGMIPMLSSIVENLGVLGAE
jgi:hypothetical protein